MEVPYHKESEQLNMDPNATWTEIQDLEEKIYEGELLAVDLVDASCELLDLYRALAGWLACGGFQPEDWSN